ncbi:MAG: hydrogenase maturation protease [Actinomycetota bacterium]|nr:hydrogenase maturation protease [Actinomycetota bacterium]
MRVQFYQAGYGKEETMLVLGLGNQLMSDDAIGVVVARRLGKWPMSGLSVAAAGTPGYGLLDMVSPHDRVVFIDAVDAGRAPGAVFWVEPESILRESHHQSLHQIGLSDVLSLMAVAGEMPWVGIIGVQPHHIGAGTKLSGALRCRLPIITSKAAEMLRGISNSQEVHAEYQAAED